MRGKKKVFILVSAIGVTVAILAAVLVTVVSKQRAEEKRIQAKIEEHLNSLKEAGEPLTFDDLAELYPDPPPEKDAKLLLTPVLNLLSIPDDTEGIPFFSDAELPKGADEMSDEMRVAIQELLDANEAALNALKEIDLEGAWFANGFSQWISNPADPPLSELNHLAKLLCLKAVLSSEDQDHEEAARLLFAAFQLSDVAKGPTQVSYLIEGIIKSTTSEALKRVLNQLKFNNEELASLGGNLKNNQISNFKNSIAVERVLSITIFETFRSASEQFTDITIARLITSFFVSSVYREVDFLTYLGWDKQMSQSFELSGPEQVEWFRSNQPPKPQDIENASAPLSMTLMDFSRPFSEGTKLIAKPRLAKTAIAIEQYRSISEDRLPNTLEELIPNFIEKIPLDPFSDEPLKYQKLERGFMVYSIGADFVDDLGKPEPVDAEEGETFDITFIVER